MHIIEVYNFFTRLHSPHIIICHRRRDNEQEHERFLSQHFRHVPRLNHMRFDTLPDCTSECFSQLS